ncbi:MAG: DUF2281 domain-containing protein [Cytophagales bacterium]|nr:MAG: DUF2281 domain-containing protein [Cytophagales bacterium]
MLTTIEATYENGQIVWDEQPPVQDKTKILVTFMTIDKPSVSTNVVRFGSLKGKISIPDDFNEPLDDLKDYMY